VEIIRRMFGPLGQRTHIVGILRDVTELMPADASNQEPSTR